MRQEQRTHFGGKRRGAGLAVAGTGSCCLRGLPAAFKRSEPSESFRSVKGAEPH